MDKTAILKEAQKFLAKGQIDRAIQEFEKLTDSEDGNIYNTLGDLYLKKGDSKKASELFHVAAKIFREKGFYDKAKALYKKLLNINPSDYRATLFLGEIAQEKGLTTEAIKHYLAVSEVLLKANKRNELVEIYKRILDLQPSNISMRVKIADLLSKHGFSQEAERQYAIIAKLYHDSGNLTGAKDYYTKTLSLDPSDRIANLGLADIYQGEGNYSGAVECLKRLISTNPEDPEILSRYLNVLSLIGDISQARDELKRLVELDPSNIMAKKYLASIYLQNAQKEEAWDLVYPSLDQIISFDRNGIISMLEELKDVEPVECTKKLIVIYKETGDMDKAFQELVNLGDYYLTSGNTDSAIACYKEALNIKPDDTYVRTKLLEIEAPSEEPEGFGVKEEKGIEQILSEADIYLKFGLYDEARKRLEPLKAMYPEHVDLHLKLKQLYIDMDDREMAVTECLILKEIYQRQGMDNEAEEILREARSIFPEDPRLQTYEYEKETEVSEKEMEQPEIPESVPSPSKEEYREAFIEAEFYEKHGLFEDALKIYKNLQSLFPEDEVISGKINELSSQLEKEPVPLKIPDEAGETIPIPEEESELLNISELLNVAGEAGVEQKESEPELSDAVMDIFEEFKKGLEEQVKEEDSETHYNLGIAYKEMGLIDDAIKEFQLARKDPARYISATHMLTICYKEKGLNKLAIETLEDVLKGMDKTQDEYLAMKYELADAYERNGELGDAFNIYMEIYGIDSSFRDVSSKVESLKKKTPKEGKNIPSPESKEAPKKKDRISYL